jgi:hypothetical protein
MLSSSFRATCFSLSPARRDEVGAEGPFGFQTLGAALASLGLPGSAVPEPAGLLVILTGAAGSLLRRQVRSKTCGRLTVAG